MLYDNFRNNSKHLVDRCACDHEPPVFGCYLASASHPSVSGNMGVGFSGSMAALYHGGRGGGKRRMVAIDGQSLWSMRMHGLMRMRLLGRLDCNHIKTIAEVKEARDGIIL
jgi:hypothetical protein